MTKLFHARYSNNLKKRVYWNPGYSPLTRSRKLENQSRRMAGSRGINFLDEIRLEMKYF